MADHVGIGKVQNDRVIGFCPDSSHQLFGYFRGRHFRLQVIGRNLGRGYQNTVFAFENLFFAAVKEEGYMRIFFGFRNAQLFHARPGNNFAKDIWQHLRRIDRIHIFRMVGRIFDHAGLYGEFDRGATVKAVKVRCANGGQNFARAVGAEIGHQKPVAIFHAIIIANHGRQNEFIRGIGIIGRLDRGFGTFGGAAIGVILALHHREVGLADTFPAVVAIHRVITPGDGHDFNIGIANQGAEFFKEFGCTFGRGIAAIQIGMDFYRHTG